MTTLTKIFASLLLLLACAAAAPASAQTRVDGTRFRERTVRDDTLLEAGRFSLFVGATGGWAYGSVSSDVASRSQNTVFSLPSIGVGYMLTDALQLRAAVNGIVIFSGIDGAQAQETYGVGGTLQGLYHLAIVHGMAFYAGLGVGGYYSTRFEPTALGMSARVSGGGFHAQLPFGLLVQPGASLFIRGGVRLDFLVGQESSEVAGVASATNLNFLTNAELSVGFRF
ncbi:MAG: hypothetical protein AB8I08_28410 [Sandaracinaceae bacterium]